MDDIKTPAQIAYEAYAAVMVPLAPWGTPDFAQLPDIHQRAWEAAAEAVMALVCDSSRQLGRPKEEEP